MQTILQPTHSRLVPFTALHLRSVRIVLALLSIITFQCKDADKIPSAKEVVSFAITNLAQSKTSIDNDKGTILITVPFGTLLTDRTVEVVLSEGAVMVPSAAIPQDFTEPVIYTITGLDGSKKVYTVSVTTEEQPDIKITTLSKDTLRAGDTLWVTGENFGASVLYLGAYLKKSNGTETGLSIKLIDANHLRLIVPTDVQPDDYQLLLSKNNKRIFYKNTLNIRIPIPEITDLRRYNLLQGDTLVLAGKYIIPDRYTYNIKVIGQNSITLVPISTESGKLTSLVPTHLSAGSYELAIHNVTENTTSMPFTRNIQVYSNLFPFIRGILNKQSSYRPGQTVEFKTVNFKSLPARFYTVQLTGNNQQYNQNGIYNDLSNTLSIILPEDLPAANYRIRTLFLNSSGEQIYELELDEQLTLIP